MADGNIFIGEVLKGKPGPQGTLIYQSGIRFVGNLHDGKAEGKGEALFPNGDRYIGDVRNDELEGFGTYHFSNGDSWSGMFTSSKYGGLGVYRWKNGGWRIGAVIDGEPVNEQIEFIPDKGLVCGTPLKNSGGLLIEGEPHEINNDHSRDSKKSLVALVDAAPMLLTKAPRRFVWTPTVRIDGRRRARWACGQVACRPVHMSTGRV